MYEKRQMEQILELHRGYDLPERARCEGTVPIISSSGCSGYHNQYKCNGENVITGRYGTIGEVFYYEGKCWPLNTALYVSDFKENCPRYIYYLLKYVLKSTIDGKDKSTVPGVDRNVLHQMYIPYCQEVQEQKKIIGILESIDKKIQVNDKINDNLQQQTQLIFDYIFQDLSGSKHVGDFIIPQRGTALSSKDTVLGDVPVVAGGLEPSTYHNIANTLAPVITISSSGANAGFVNLWGIPVWSSDSSYIDSSMTPYVYFWYAFLKRHQNNIYRIQTGSAQPHIYPNHIISLPISNIDYKKVDEYTQIVTPIFLTITENHKENHQLKSVRDWLLPMLMNGQTIISD